MLSFRYLVKSNASKNSWLYYTVFAGRFSTFLTFILFASFIIQPINKAFAIEPAPLTEVEPVAKDVRPQEEAVSEIVVEETAPAEEVVPGENPPNTMEDIDTNINTDPVEEDNLVDDGLDVAPVDGVENSDSGVAENEQTTKKEKAEDVVEIQSLVTEDNFYQFSKQSCVETGAGVYHCTVRGETGADSASLVYTELGESGNLEVFLRTSKNRVKQITDNNQNDVSPHYDAESMRIVWSREIDGRHQIILYDLVSEQESQLTFSKTNNMEPKVGSDGIVWQAWDNNDWEIMFFDGAYTEQITENETQDVAPVIQDRYVLWNVLGGEEQQARVYSLDTKEVVSIEGYEGGSIANPRFVLVYDTEFDNGDVVTQTFDPATGLSEPVASRPAPEPLNLPESDPVGEIRALITSGKSKDEKQLLEVENDNVGSVATSTDDGSLNLKAGSDVAPDTTLSGTLEDEQFELTEYDLVIPEGALEQALQETE